MYRFLLTPRWWGINVFAALAIPFCLFMGSWQLGRFEARADSHREQQQSAESTARQTAEPLAGLLPVTQRTTGRIAEARGTYGTQLLVPDRRLDGRDGFYVLTLLRTAGGPALPVVRGWLPGDANTADVPAPPKGEVTVTGALQAPENRRSEGARAGGLPEGQIGIISAAALVNVVPDEVHNAWITLTEGRDGLRPVPPAVAQNTGLDLKAFQNLGYTGEWFVFAGFVLFMWFRLFRREVETQRDLALGLTPDPAGPATGPAPSAGGGTAPAPAGPAPSAGPATAGASVLSAGTSEAAEPAEAEAAAPDTSAPADEPVLPCPAGTPTSRSDGRPRAETGPAREAEA
ncbi:SURF1 family protein [Streptomyces sp. F63]|uniref:SURF1 family protein n=1 Tax=Streptomyces sp. F63 TaxID=2824887 RepID=UPI001B359276|nr:SURF1 family protein [Streptomyces sp. F63]MBQ0985456.1 SURF1 family protein [Streptomyces sp. F63]